MDNIFLSLSSPNPSNFSITKKYHSTFIPALILSCLNKLSQTPKTNRLRKKIVSFLLSQKSPFWSFNYWIRGSTEAKSKPIPDDLDCTFVSLSALFEYDPKLISGEALAKITTLLTTLESRVGGPYRTWLTLEASSKWKDVDLVVNANIAYFLSLQGVKLPNLDKFISSKIASLDFYSPYYPSKFVVIYFLSRFFKGKGIDKMIKQIQKPTNPLEAALSLSAQINFGISSKKFQDLVKLIKDSDWKAYGFCIDPAVAGKPYYSGSPALTAAFCLEALAKYSSQNSLHARKASPLEAKIYKKVIKSIRDRYSTLRPNLKKQAFLRLDKILRMKQKDEIILLPYFFASSLSSKKEVPNSLLIKLGMASVYGWIAYTIYDDFLDLEGEVKNLPVANLALRELTIIFTSIPDFQNQFSPIMDKLEAANAWEVSQTSIPDYKDYSQLAEKSFGIALGPLAILHFLGFKIDSKEVKYTLEFFKHFIIGKQLNDDAHDWEEDFKKGLINSVGAKLLRKKINPKKYKEVFWRTILPEVSREILYHTKRARNSIKRLDIYDNFLVFEQLLSPIEDAAYKALAEHSKTKQFLKEYGS